MLYACNFTKRALKDIKDLSKDDRTRVFDRIENLKDNLSGDVKKLTNHVPEYRMRCGNWRVLFEVNGSEIIIHRILNRKEAYQ